MNIKTVCIITFFIYYLIASIFFFNILFNPKFNLILVNKKTKKEMQPPTAFIILFCLLWIIYIPLSIFKGEQE